MTGGGVDGWGDPPTIITQTHDQYRVGRSLGRTIYRQIGEEPSKDDDFLGIMDTRALAAMVVDALNGVKAEVEATAAWCRQDERATIAAALMDLGYDYPAVVARNGGRDE